MLIKYNGSQQEVSVIYGLLDFTISTRWDWADVCGGGCVAWSSLERQRKKRLLCGLSLWVWCVVLSLFFCHTRFLFVFLLLSSSFFHSPLPLLPRPVESDNTLRIKNEKTRSLLLFTNVTEKHFGNYTCFASNRLGASNASMLLFRKLSDRAARHTHADQSVSQAHARVYLYSTINQCAGVWTDVTH